jgi:hypothetical protein
MGNRERTGIVKLVRMPMMVSFRPAVTNTLPFAYAFDAKSATTLRPVLGLHGIKVERLSAPVTVTAQAFTLDSVTDRGQSESARRMRNAPGKWTDPATRTLPAGTFVVRAGQPYGLLAFYLLEPENDDGLLSWGFLEGLVSAQAAYPVIRVIRPVTLRTTTAK